MLPRCCSLGEVWTLCLCGRSRPRPVLENPLSGQRYDVDTVMRKWVRIAGALAIAGRPLAGRSGFNPVLAMARSLMDGYGLDDQAARLRAAQIVAVALGWRVFEEYLVAAGGAVPLETLQEDLVHSARRLGATPWPSPTDPSMSARQRSGSMVTSTAPSLHRGVWSNFR
jgi:hypothetical protein